MGYTANPLLVISLALGCWGCHHASPEWDKTVSQFPVVRVDTSRPKTERYILHFPAGHTLDTMVFFQGNLFEEPDQQSLALTLNRDVYVYEDWVSFDRKTWMTSDQVFDFTLDIQLPSYDKPRVSRIDMALDVKE